MSEWALFNAQGPRVGKRSCMVCRQRESVDEIKLGGFPDIQSEWACVFHEGKPAFVQYEIGDLQYVSVHKFTKWGLVHAIGKGRIA